MRSRRRDACAWTSSASACVADIAARRASGWGAGDVTATPAAAASQATSTNARPTYAVARLGVMAGRRHGTTVALGPRAAALRQLRDVMVATRAPVTAGSARISWTAARRAGASASESSATIPTAPDVLAAQGEAGDVDAVASQQGADRADDARLIVVVQHHDDPLERRLDLDAVEHREPRRCRARTPCLRPSARLRCVRSLIESRLAKSRGRELCDSTISMPRCSAIARALTAVTVDGEHRPQHAGDDRAGEQARVRAHERAVVAGCRSRACARPPAAPRARPAVPRAPERTDQLGHPRAARRES